MGRNEHISWSFAASRESSEALAPLGEDDDLTERHEALLVRGESGRNDSFQSVSVREVRATVSGRDVLLPVLGDLLPQNVQNHLGRTSLPPSTLSSNALTQPIDLSFLRSVAAAQGWDQFSAACGAQNAMSLNVLYADVNGNIGAIETGAASKRSAVLNPDSGYILLSSSGAAGTGDRLQELVSAAVQAGGVDSAAASRILADCFSPSASKLVALVLRSEAGEGKFSKESERMVRAAHALVSKGFDGVYAPAASAPVLLEAFRAALVHKLASHNSGAAVDILLGGARLTALRRHQATDM